MRYQTGALGGWQNKKRWLMTTMMSHTRWNDKRSQNSTAPTQNAYTRGYNTWYHTVRQHSKLRRQQAVTTASKHRQTKGGIHESGRFYRSATAATDRHRQPAALLFVVVAVSMRATDFTAVPPLLPIDIDNQQHCWLLLLAEEDLWAVAV